MEEENPDEDKNITLLVKRFGKFLQNDKTFRFGKIRKFFKKKEVSTLNQIFTCFECMKQCHMKAYYPNISKKSSHKEKKEFKSKKACIAWDDNEVSSSSNSKNEEYANFALIASHHSDDEQEVIDCELNHKPSYEELQNAFHELHEECLILSRTCAKQKKLIYL